MPSFLVLVQIQGHGSLWPTPPTPDFVNEIKPIGVGFLLQCRDPIGALSVNDSFESLKTGIFFEKVSEGSRNLGTSRCFGLGKV